MMKLADRYSNAQPSGMVKIFQAIERMDEVLNLSIGEPDFNTENDIIDAAAKAAKEGFTHYPPLQGFIDTRESVCAYWERHHGFEVSPEEVLMTVGGLQIPHLALQALLNPGDEVLLVEPYFSPYAVQISVCGGVSISVGTTEENGFAATVEDLEKALSPKTRILMLNSPCNPSGRVISRKKMEEIAAFVVKRNLVVLSDEIYESLVYKNAHVGFATLPGMKERTLTMAGLSKSHCMTGWRVGYAIGPRELIRVMTVISSSQTYGVNCLAQKAATYALANHDEKVNERKKIFAKRMDYVAERLNKMRDISCAAAEGAFYLFPNIKKTGFTSEDFAWKLLKEAHVATIPGIAFGKSGEGYIRIACTQSIEVLTQAMDRMEKFLSR
jgi:aspartate/methionine/tyrosine aminotransferase